MAEVDAVGIARLAEQNEAIRSDVSEIKREVEALSKSFERLARLEERQDGQKDAVARAFTKVEALDDRIKKIEVQEPVAKLVQKWVIMGVIGVVSIFGLQLAAVVFQQSKPTQITIEVDDVAKLRSKPAPTSP